jgi:hypothetical protein
MYSYHSICQGTAHTYLVSARLASARVAAAAPHVLPMKLSGLWAVGPRS